MNAWAYSDAEIATLYRGAFDPNYQIRVLAELNNRSRQDVIEKLRSLGFAVKGTGEKFRKSNLARKKRVNEWTQDEVSRLIEGVTSGKKLRDIPIPGRSRKAIGQKAVAMGLRVKDFRKGKKGQAITGRVAE